MVHNGIASAATRTPEYAYCQIELDHVKNLDCSDISEKILAYTQTVNSTRVASGNVSDLTRILPLRRRSVWRRFHRITALRTSEVRD